MQALCQWESVDDMVGGSTSQTRMLTIFGEREWSRCYHWWFILHTYSPLPSYVMRSTTMWVADIVNFVAFISYHYWTLIFSDTVVLSCQDLLKKKRPCLNKCALNAFGNLYMTTFLNEADKEPMNTCIVKFWMQGTGAKGHEQFPDCFIIYVYYKIPQWM